jgi:hypothetical protein
MQPAECPVSLAQRKATEIGSMREPMGFLQLNLATGSVAWKPSFLTTTSEGLWAVRLANEQKQRRSTTTRMNG